MDFIDDENLVARGIRPVARAVDNFADIVDPGVGGGVDLQHVDIAVLGDRRTARADAAGIDRRSAVAVRPGAVQGAGDEPGGRRLADAAHAGEDEGVVNPAQPDGVGQGADENVLADQFVEGGRPVFARQHPVFRIGLRTGFSGIGAVGH